MTNETSSGVLLNMGQMKIAEKANDRVSKLREAVIKTKHRAARLILKEKYKKEFNVAKIEKEVSKAKRTLRRVQDDLAEASALAEAAASAEMAKLESKVADELETESIRTTSASLSILGASLPDDIRKELQLDETKKLITTSKK